MMPAENRAELCSQFVEKLGWKGKYFIISALTGEGCKLLTYAIMDYLEQNLPPQPDNPIPENELVNP